MMSRSHHQPHRQRTHPAPAEIIDGRDLGPAIRRKTIAEASGAVLRLPTAAEAEWHEPSDPMSTAKPPVVHGARAMTGLDHLAARRSDISAGHLAAAARYARTVETIMSAGYGSAARLPNGLPPGISAAAIDPATRALGAVAEHRDAVQVLGLRASALLWDLVVDGKGVILIAKTEGVYRPLLVELLIGALNRLVKHYWPDGRAGTD
jgi:hypothetical protein